MIDDRTAFEVFVMVWLVLLVILAQPPQAPEPPQAPPVKSDYEIAYAHAVATGRPLVVGVRCDPPRGDWVTVRVDRWTWDATVIVSRPYGDVMLWVADLNANAKSEDVRWAITPRPAATRAAAPVRRAAVVNC